jgi:hypothetical protein
MRDQAPTRHLLVIGVLTLIVMACAVGPTTGPGIITPTPQSTITARATVTPPVNAGNLPTLPQGNPAITPSGTGAQALTEADVRAYLQQHPTMPYAQRDSRVSISSIAFLPSRAVQAALHGESTGYPSTALLCLVVVTGFFDFPHPPDATAQYRQGFLVYDAANGNLIMSGGIRTTAVPGVAAAAWVGGPARRTIPAARTLQAVSPSDAAPAGSVRAAVLAAPERPARPGTYNCPDSAHCYAVAEWSAQALQTCCLAGGEVNISYTDLSGGDGFVDNELWLVQHGNAQCINLLLNIPDVCWVEVGMIAEPSQFSGTRYFWADNTPALGFAFHPLGLVPSLDQNPQTPDGFFITADGPDTYQVAIIGLQTNSALIFAYSTNNAMTPDTLEMGQELYGTNGARSASFADYSFLTYYSGEFGLNISTTPSTQRSDSPPVFTWINVPSNTIYGEFHTQCC